VLASPANASRLAELYARLPPEERVLEPDVVEALRMAKTSR
jgi:hypothetical protein